MNRRFLFLIFTVLICFALRAQTQLKDIDQSKIKQKSIRNFLNKQIESGIIYFEDFQPSVTAQTDSDSFDFNEHVFKIKQPQSDTWNAYLSAHPAKIWQGRIVSCGLIYSPRKKQIIFPDDAYTGLEVGQIFFVEMRLIFRLAKFPVCFMVTGIDAIKQTITFSYVASGSSKGSQTIRLISKGNGETKIIHSSIHQTQNALRDKTLYPIYHRKAIGEVHKNIKKQLLKNQI
jgi:hypothetical protein